MQPRGRPDRYKREDNTSTPHLQIRVLDAGGQPWRIAVNVQSSTGSDVVFWVVDPLAGHPLLASVPARAPGFVSVARNAGNAFDYVKAPLFDWTLGRTLPPSGQASSTRARAALAAGCAERPRAAWASGSRRRANTPQTRLDPAIGPADRATIAVS